MTTTRQRTKYDVYFMTEGEILVRGTLDPAEALKLAADRLEEQPYIDNLLFGVSRHEYINGFSPYGELDPDAVKAFGDKLHDMLQNAKPGLYRKNVCPPDHWDGWAWQLGYGKAKGHGTFEGVLFE